MNTKVWTQSVKNELENLNAKLKQHPSAKDKYFGFEVIDGKLKKSPEILFIGINPGKGDGKRSNDIKMETDRISYLDYFNEGYYYPLASETIKLFRAVGLSDNEIIEKLTNQWVKTNFFYIKTEKESDIESCLKYLGKDAWLNFYKKSAEFTVDLISILKPRLVIFEGKSSYDNVIEVCFEQKRTWNYGYGYYYSHKDNIHFIGYERSYSNIKSDLSRLAKAIKDVLIMK